MWIVAVAGAALALGHGLPPGAAMAAPTAPPSAPADSLAELWRALGACARVSGVPAEAVGSEVTVLFTLRRDGQLQGRPRITHSRLIGDAAAQRSFVAGALAAVARCMPLPITEGLGGAIAGRPLRLRLTSPRPERAA